MLIRTLFAAAWLLLLAPQGAQAGSLPACTSLSASTERDITVGGVCRNITNNTGRTICVPTGNTSMWNSYITKTIPNVTIAACGGPPPDCGAGPGSCSYTNHCDNWCIANGGFHTDIFKACRPRHRCTDGIIEFTNNTDPGCNTPPECF